MPNALHPKCRALFFSALLALTGALPAFAQSSPAPSSPADDPYCTISPEALKYVSPGTLKMASLLERLAREANPSENPFLNGRRAANFRDLAPTFSDPAQALQAQFNYATSLLDSGQTLEAIAEYDRIEELRKRSPGLMGWRQQSELRANQAVAWLRLGEQENCLTNHTSASCIMPISADGVHKLTRGSTKAIELLEDQLKRTPNNRLLVWLLNVAYMTLGKYPDSLPPTWLIPPQAFASDYDIQQFPDVAPELGLDVNDYAGGTVTEDFDLDGDLDLLISDWSTRGTMHYFQNNGDGSLSDKTIAAGLAGLIGGLNMIHGDYNNDGLPDVLILRGAWLFEEGKHPDSLLRNDGKGHFSDVTEEAGLLAFHPNQTAAWLDYNGDGWLDLYFGYESSAAGKHPCKLFRNNRNGTFTECAREVGVAAVGFVKGVTSADFNNDGRPDLFLSLRGQPNILYRNDGPTGAGGWKFTDVSTAAGVTEPIASFATWFFDYDNDGWEDLYVGGYSIRDAGDIAADFLGAPHNAERPRLFRNNRNGSFTDVTKAARLFKVVHAMGANFGDFDNDGWLDMYLGTGDPLLSTVIPNRAFRNAGGASFQEVTTSGGFGHLQKGHGVSFADLDNDGDQDIYHSVGGAYEGDFYRNVLFENPGHGHHWISIKLAGKSSNAAGIGARLKLTIVDNGTERAIHRTVSTGGSFGANPLRQEIGLAGAATVQSLEVTWPVTGQTQRFANLAADRRYQVDELAGLREDSSVGFKFQKGQIRNHPHSPQHSAWAR